MKKRILLMVPMLDQGGLERMCAYTAVLLKETYFVTVVVFNGKNRLYDLGEVELIDLHLGSKDGKINKMVNVLKRVYACKKIKKIKKIDITYSFGNTANIVNVLSRVRDKIFVGIRGYGALSEEKIMDLICKKADMIVCCTKVLEEELRIRYLEKKVITVHNPCNTEEIKKLSEEELKMEEEFFQGSSKMIATMGRMNDVKGFWHVIKIFYLLQLQMPDVKLFFIGDQSSAEYEKLANDYGISDKVRFLGVQKNPFKYLKYADAYLMTSETEGFPNALIEAMTLGVPVLSVNCKTGPSEILMENHRDVEDMDKVYEGNYGILLPIMNPKKNLDKNVIEPEEEIAAKELEKLFLSEEKQEKYRSKALERACYFAPEKYVERLGRVF